LLEREVGTVKSEQNRGPKGKPRSREQIALDTTADATPDTRNDSTDDAAATSPPRRAAQSSALPTRDNARYERGEEIAHGGIGRVLSAWDGELDRPIAVKELLAPSPERARRFEREVRITARLQHPAIIGLLEGGRWPSGEPFFTMKRVEGKPLDEAIAERTTLDERLALLPHAIATAEALAYAHAQRIIHRDLKPANVLVGSYGETVVIDWGLAKDLSKPSESDDAGKNTPTTNDPQLTALGAALGTPAYMAPEQASGLPVDERADVYSLGAMLYHLLSGARPYHDTGASTASQLLQKVLTGPPKRLDELEPRAPTDLLAIVSKAMARRPERRYADAGEIADELKRFQTGKLVAAYDYSKSDLLRRWIARHRAAVSVAVVMLSVLAVVAVASVWRITRERDAAEEQRAIADQQRGLAERDREKVEDLLDFMLVDLKEKLDPLGKLALLEEVANKAQEYYLARPPSSDRPDEARRRALAHKNLGDVLFDQGHLDRARSEYASGVAIAQRLVERDPTEPSSQFLLATNHQKLGRALREQGKYAEAMEHLRSSLAIARKLVERHPDALPAQMCLGKSHYALGEALAAAGKTEAALTEHRAGLEVAQKLASQHPDDSDVAESLLLHHTRLAVLLEAQGELDDALAHYQTALDMSQQLVARDATNVRWQRKLAMNQINVGDVLKSKGDVEAANEQYRKAMLTSELLARQDPLNADRQRDLSLAHERLGGTARLLGDLSSSLEHYRAALSIAEELAKLETTSVTAHNDLARYALHVGMVLRAKGETAAARPYFRRCADAYQKHAVSYEDFYNTACCDVAAGNADHAFEMLDEAFAKGFRNASWLVQDPDLAPLRTDLRWKILVDRMQRSEP